MQVMGFRKDRWKVIVDLVSGEKRSVSHKLKGKAGNDSNAKTDEHMAIDVDLHTNSSRVYLLSVISKQQDL